MSELQLPQRQISLAVQKFGAYQDELSLYDKLTKPVILKLVESVNAGDL